MKQLKRVLALVLVAAVLCSFALAAAPSATVKYTDASSIKHNEAVDVLSALGVIQGYKNGSFKPATTVTRAEMAKMLAVLLNKGIDPGESYTDACTFVDAANHWGRTYIGFCVAEGLINGKSATKFDPDGKVTGVEAAKMLLGALGYKAAIHGLTGPQWEANTVGLAMRDGCKLFESIDSAAIYKSLSRDDACQIMLNALKADTVDCSYQEGSVPLFDGSGITTSAVNHVHNTINNAPTADYRQGGASSNSVEQLCERLFPSLKLQVNTTTNVDGHPASQWNNGGKTLGVYQLSAPISTSNSTHTAKTILSKISTKYPQKVLVTYDGCVPDAGKTFQGVRLDDGSCTMAQLKQMFANVIPNAVTMSDAAFASSIKSGTASSINKTVGASYSASLFVQLLREDAEYAKVYNSSGTTDKYLGWNGVHSEAFYDEATETVTYAAQPLYCVKVTAYRPAVLDDEGNELQKAYVLARPLNGTPGNNMAPLYLNDTDTVPSSTSSIAIDLAALDDPESVEKDTCLAVQFGYDNEENGFVVIAGSIMELVNITVDRVSASGADTVSSVRFGKSNYSRAALTPNTQNQFIIGQSKILYTIASDGNVLFLFFEDGNTAAADYLYLIGSSISKEPLSEKPYSAGVVNMKGEQSVVATKVDYGVLGDNLNSGFVTYTKDANDVYTFAAAGTKGAGRIDILSGRSAITINECSTVTGTPTGTVHNLSADDKTLFLVELPDAAGKATYTTYTGVKNVPTLTTADGDFSYYAYSVGENGHLTALYVGHNLVKTAAATGDYGTLFITGEETKQVIENNASYYSIAAIVNGKEETLKVDANYKDNTLGSGYRGFYLFNSYSTNESGIVDNFDPTNGYLLNNLTPPSAGVIGMNGDYLTYTSNSLCYAYSVGQRRLSVSTVDAVYNLNTSNPAYQSFYTVNREYPNIVATLAAVID